MINEQELYEKLTTGEPLSNEEIVHLMEVRQFLDEAIHALIEYEQVLQLEWAISERAIQELKYYKRLANIRK